MLHFIQTSSLEKILPATSCDAVPQCRLTVLSGETASYQLAFRADEMDFYNVTITAEPGIKPQVYTVDNVPVSMPTFPEALSDPGYISHEPGLFPDVLKPLDNSRLHVGCWYRALWITVAAAAPGTHRITVTFDRCPNPDLPDRPGEEVVCTFELTVLPEALPKQSLIFTQWFHTDCISSYYGIESFSERHWELIEKFLGMAADNGVNMILTPLFTPPLDTEIGGERPTAQLLSVSKSGDHYTFGFDKVRRWIKLCKKLGFRYFEMPHLFTQWGASCTPKILAEENGRLKRIFGWDVAADDPSYDIFLSQLIPQLTAVLREEGVADDTYFHISDEPAVKNIDAYLTAKGIAAKYLNGFYVIDAMSEYEFYRDGDVEHPIPSLDKIDPFLEAGVKDLWTYYCCSQHTGVSNRFIAMPSVRNRFLAVQLYRYDIRGFLHWGYNYYYTFLSKTVLNPFFETDAGGYFPAGDAFSVYPGADGPLPSLRLFVFREALQDIRAMQLLESYIGRDAVILLIEDFFGRPIKFDECCADAQKLLALREKINLEIEKHARRS